MRFLTFVAVLALSGVVLAQASEEQLTQCMKSCCDKYKGQWNPSDQYCEIGENDPNYDALSQCEFECIFGGETTTTGGPTCCGPAAGLLALAGFFAIKRN
jgi:hypothetical protein